MLLYIHKLESRDILKKILGFLFVVGCLVLFGVYYAYNIEPYRIHITYQNINNPSKHKKVLKIAQLTDTHIKEDFTPDELVKVVEKTNELKPDIILFSGDLYDNYAIYHNDKEVIKQLSKLKAKYQKIAIWGNRDRGGGAHNAYPAIMAQTGFTLLDNENLSLTIRGKRILFTGIDDLLLGNPAVPPDYSHTKYDYKILLTHETENMEAYAVAGYNLVLSGHSHGGQVDIPLLKFINKKILEVAFHTTKYSRGLYQLNKHTKLFVSSGIGTTHVSARFGVVPEIALLSIDI